MLLKTQAKGQLWALGDGLILWQGTSQAITLYLRSITLIPTSRKARPFCKKAFECVSSTSSGWEQGCATVSLEQGPMTYRGKEKVEAVQGRLSDFLLGWPTRTCILFFIHPCNRCLLSIYSVPDVVGGAGNIDQGRHGC